VLRLDLGSRAQRRVTTPAAIDASNLRSLAWHNGALLGIRQNSDPVIARVRLNPQGTAAIAVDVLAAASGIAGTLSGDAYYYVAGANDANAALHRIPLAR
jgi:urease accessory protein UreF